MKKEFWLDVWKENNLGFHQSTVNKKLLDILELAKLNPGDHIFVPLCGKSIDLIHLVNAGFVVKGVELSNIACHDFFKENNLEYKVNKVGAFEVFSSDGIELYCGDLFELDKAPFSSIRLTYDRASYIALPEDMRRKYVDKMKEILPKDSLYGLVSMDFGARDGFGPPHSIETEEISNFWSTQFSFDAVQTVEAEINIPRFLEKGLKKSKQTLYFGKKLV